MTDFEIHWNTIKGSLRGYAFTLTHNQADAEDLLSETWLRTFRKFDQYTNAKSFQSWAYQIMKNIHCDHGRMKLRRVNAMSYDALTETDLLEVLEVPSPEPVWYDFDWADSDARIRARLGL